MNINIDIITVFVGLILLVILIYGIIHRFISTTYTDYKLITKEESLEELLYALTLVMNTIFEQYNNNIFSKKKALDNAGYENYYTDVCSKVYDAISPTLMKKLTYYITEDSIYEFIAMSVNKYIAEKA